MVHGLLAGPRGRRCARRRKKTMAVSIEPRRRGTLTCESDRVRIEISRQRWQRRLRGHVTHRNCHHVPRPERRQRIARLGNGFRAMKSGSIGTIFPLRLKAGIVIDEIEERGYVSHHAGLKKLTRLPGKEAAHRKDGNGSERHSEIPEIIWLFGPFLPGGRPHFAIGHREQPPAMPASRRAVTRKFKRQRIDTSHAKVSEAVRASLFSVPARRAGSLLSR